MDEYKFTNKAQESLNVAIQLAKDYSNAQVHPFHLASALLNDNASLLTSVIQKSGGDPVCAI